MAGFKEKQADSSYWKLSQDLYSAIAPVFEVDPSEIRRCWYSNANGDYENVAKESVLQCRLSRIRVYPKRLKKAWLLKLWAGVVGSDFWEHYTQYVVADSEVIMLFMLGVTPWLITMSSGRKVCPLEARIIIPVPQMSPAFMMPAALYNKECL